VVTEEGQMKDRRKQLDDLINASKPDKKTVRFAESRNQTLRYYNSTKGAKPIAPRGERDCGCLIF
jgi:hypothetical protein